jgi:hypothetical protein
VLLESFKIISLVVNVFPFLLLLLRNYVEEIPLRFLMPVSTFAFAFIAGSLIYSYP